MKKLLLLVIVSGALVALALSALAEEAGSGANAPAPAPAKAAKAPVKARVTAAKAPAKAPAAPAATAAEDGGGEAEPEEASDSGDVATLPEGVAGFVEAMREQITKVGGTPTCDAEAGRCYYRYRNGDGPSHEIHLWYSEAARSIYIFVNHFASAPESEAYTPTLLRHLAAANRVMEVSRFEWHRADGEVRLSTVMNVDTNFDRYALQSLLRLIQAAADRYHPIVGRITENHENAGDPPRPEQRQAGSGDRHGYMAAIEAELRALNLNPSCDTDAARCTYELDSEEARNVFPITVQYNNHAHTILITTDRFVTAGTDNPRLDAVIERLLELNWEQLAPMFQWDASSGAVRVAAVVNTDSNLDRRALRGVVQAVNRVSERRYREIRGMLNP